MEKENNAEKGKKTHITLFNLEYVTDTSFRKLLY